KGKPLPGKHKQREELETVVGSGAVLALLLQRSGYQPVFRYEKYRNVFFRAGAPGVITVDESSLARLLELEGESGWIDETAVLLGFREDDYITASYATLYSEDCRAKGIEPTHFVFPTTDSESSDANG